MLTKPRLLILAAIVMLLLSLAVGWVWRQKLEGQKIFEPEEMVALQEKNRRNPKEVVVELTPAGFSPTDQTVFVGDTVLWTNRSKKPMWIKQNSDQSEKLEPPLDQRSWSPEYRHTFTKTGKWQYDNYSPFFSGGTVTVNE